MGKKADKFADAVRVLLWGNGDVHDQIKDLEKVLAEYDEVPVKPGEMNRLAQITNWHVTVKDIEYYSSDLWNKEDANDND